MGLRKTETAATERNKSPAANHHPSRGVFRGKPTVPRDTIRFDSLPCQVGRKIWLCNYSLGLSISAEGVRFLGQDPRMTSLELEFLTQIPPAWFACSLWWHEFGCWKWTKLGFWARYAWFVSLLNFELKSLWLISKRGLKPTNQIYLAGTQTKQTHFRATLENPSPFSAHLLVWPNDAACCETFSVWRQVDRSGRHDSNRFGGLQAVPSGGPKWVHCKSRLSQGNYAR